MEEEMTIHERWKYLRMMRDRYKAANRKTKTQLLDEMEMLTGMHRKSLIDRIGGSLDRKPRQQERGKTYGPEVDDTLRVIDETYDGICAERITPNLVWMACDLIRHGELPETPGLLDQLERISVSTVRRRLSRIRQDQPRLRRRKPGRGRKLVRNIPMCRLPWNIAEPGHFEVDLVHHSGPTAAREYACTVQMIDVATGWSERCAVLGRGRVVMEDAFRLFLARLPFPVRELHPDNDSVFFNGHMIHFWGQLVQGVTLSRTRPYHKNDNPRVEQKNSTLVRAYLGYQRFDSVAQVLALNRLYDRMWLYYNFFQPVMHLVKKEIVGQDGHPSRVRRHYDEARTPFHRLCETTAILPAHRQQLEVLRDSTNPRRLRSDIYHAIERILALPCAGSDTRQNVYLTLSTNADKGKEDPSNLAFNRTPVKK